MSIATAARDQLRGENDVFSLFGGLDAPKFKSSVTYFHQMAGVILDTELENICKELMDLLELDKNKPKPRQPFGWNMRRPISSSSSSSSEESSSKEEETGTQEEAMKESQTVQSQSETMEIEPSSQSTDSTEHNDC